MQYIWLTYVDYILIYVTRLPARSDLSLNAMSVKVLNHPQCNKPTNMLIWGIAPGTYRDEVFSYPASAPQLYLMHCNSHGHRPTVSWQRDFAHAPPRSPVCRLGELQRSVRYNPFSPTWPFFTKSAWSCTTKACEHGTRTSRSSFRCGCSCSMSCAIFRVR